jgi:purine-cytosine permease-like protein
VPYSADYSRFVRVSASGRSVIWASALGMYVPTVWPAALGACLASAGGAGDPSDLVVTTFGVTAVPVLLLIMHGPVATIVLVDYFVLRRGRVDVAGLCTAQGDSPFGSMRRGALMALGSGLVAGWSWQYGLVPAMQGPIAVAMGGTDFSWLAGGRYRLPARRG